ncbi:hypothetical protein [Kordiimonas pumila]|uniref:Solute-binding protein family 3/N-terminal domain-containing protein n=1 Tax=Kordiimonas pumila TaxID=2161677 RepID=A0ABV7D507_9PROT|nr:hypothetical protein [Kordiimonas pumila]
MRLLYFTLFCLCFLSVGSKASYALDAGQLVQKPAPVRLYVHGESDEAKQQPDGSFTGPVVDVFKCSMAALHMSYSINAVTMNRKEWVEEAGGLDLWFPLFDDGAPGKKEKLVPLGEIIIYWFIRPEITLDPITDDFKKTVKVTAFPKSAPEGYLKDNGYRYVLSTDDENHMMLWLLEGRIDAILAPDFIHLLKPGARAIAESLRRTVYARYKTGFEVTPAYQAKNPAFKAAFSKAVEGCR